MRKVLLVSEEFSGIGGSGGIGAAFEELALCLAQNGMQVDFLIVPVHDVASNVRDALEQRFARSGIRLLSWDWSKYVWSKDQYENKSYAISKFLAQKSSKYDFIHFHDYKGLGYFTLAAKRQGLAFQNTIVVVQAHGPTRWTVDANKTLFTHPDQLRIDFMERRSIEWADYLISPSSYLIQWMKSTDYNLPVSKNIRVIKNICTLASRFAASFARYKTTTGPAQEIIYFARHEDRKGFAAFCDAVDDVADDLADRGIAVTFLGKLGEIHGRPSGVELTNRAKHWRMPIRIRTQLDRYGALGYLGESARSVVVIPSPTENSPYTVVEASVIGKPVITSREGGAKELIASPLHDVLLADITREGLAERLRTAIAKGLPPAELAETPQAIEAQWVELHHDAEMSAQGRTISPPAAVPKTEPKVTFGITHYERTQKLTEALVTAIRQDYPNLEIIVVDDGSSSEEALAGLQDVERILERVGGRLIRQQNKYLGAARNTVARETSSDYLLFLDDDDLAYRNLTSTLVRAACRTQADITGCFNVFLEEKLRPGIAPAPEAFPGKVSYAPLGGPLSVAPFENWLGAATALIKRSHFERLGGYTEMRGVGFEDYEFFVRSLQIGAHIEVVPEPLYLYEVGRPSMISRTSIFHNYRRVLESIDLSASKSDWYDLIAMNTGRKVLEERANRIHWEYRTSSESEFLLPLLDVSVTPAQYAERLAAYADAIDAHHVARAWASSTNVSPGEQRDHQKVYPGWRDATVSKIDAPRRGLMPRDLDIIADLRLGRIEDAINSFYSNLDGGTIIDQGSSDVLRLIIQRAGQTSYPMFDRLLERLLQAECRPEVANSIITSIMVLSVQCGRKNLVRDLLVDLFEQDEAEYLRRNPDVSAILNHGSPRPGMDHYEAFGFQENRSGFDRLSNISGELSRHFGTDIKPWTLDTIFGVGFGASMR